MNNNKENWFDNIVIWAVIIVVVLVILFLYWLFAPSQVCTPYIDSQGAQKYECENYPVHRKIIDLFK